MNCFFSYSQDNNIDDNLLNEIKEYIESMSNNRINVIYDKKTFHSGDNVIEREDEILTCDSIVIFFTPSYKNKVINTEEDKGAYREYQNIKKRLENNDNNIIPVLLAGNIENAVTDEFKYILFDDISKLRKQIYINKGEISLSDTLESAIKRISREVIKKTEAYAWLKDHSFNSLEEEYDALFLNDSANLKKKLPKKCIIKTNAYENIVHQYVLFVIGRKGSGKTTLLDSIQHYNPEYYSKNYKTLCSISAESVNLNDLYNELIQSIKPDFNILDMSKVFDVFWEVFLTLQCIYTIGVELEHFRIDDNDSRKETFEKTVGIFKKKLGKGNLTLDDYTPKNAIFKLSAELLINYFNNGMLEKIDISTLSASVYNNFSSNRILQDLLGRELFVDFSKALNRCNKKILLSLDGFDPHSEDFRLNTSAYKGNDDKEYKLRKDFEILFYRELMITVSHLKEGKTDSNIVRIFDKVNFCIIIPQDRYDEIKHYDRDISKRKYCSLSWDAYELLDMLVKRLEYYYRIENNNTTTLLDKFNNIIKTKLHGIPEYVNIEIDGHNVSISLYSYILRLSFWRPRDVIRNFAVIMKLSKSEISSTNEITQEILKTLLTISAEKIIEEEFVGEYKNVYKNLSNVLNKFKNYNLINEFNEFFDKLSKIDIDSVDSFDNKGTEEKFKILYKLGVIGVYFDKKEANKHGYGYHVCYVFNEGLKPCDDLLNGNLDTTRTKVIFNTIFLKKLELNINTNELICDYDWDYISKNHLMKDTIDRI